MSKRHLILLRHAKSACPEGVDDHDRPLAERGRKAAPIIGRHIAAEMLSPDLVLVSPARRAQETWALVKPMLPKKTKVEKAPGIYEVPGSAIIDVIRSVDAAVSTLMLVGHNPGMEEAAALIAGDGDADARARMAEKFPTTGLAVIDLHIESWGALSHGCGSLQRFVTPRMLA